ncbi:hypothetical protein B0H11DRAFT_1994317 [Mycena galericulata]|nr:hypothetical protein B0H11DRAFT_1994317 [Mycena galericulata]
MFPTIAIGVAFILHAFLASWSSVKVHATLTNITIDDTNSTFWTWAGTTWHAVTPSTPCSTCTAQPDPKLAYNSTWHDGSLLSGAFTFQGTAVYIYGIDVLNFEAGNISFAFSNPSMTGFHYYGGSSYVYNSLFFSAGNLDSTVQHTVTWLIETSAGGGHAGLFDYAVVTLSQSDPSSSTAGSQTLGGSSPSSSSTTSSGSATSTSPATTTAHKSNVSIIAGAVVGVVGGLAILGALFICLRCRRSPAGQPILSDVIPHESHETPPAGTAAPTNYSIEPYQPPEHPSAPPTPALAQPRPFFSSEASLESLTMSAVPSAPVSTGTAMSSTPVSTAAMLSEPASTAPMPSAPIPTASASSDSKPAPVVMTWDPHNADGRAWDLEERLRHLEDLAAASHPPAYS